MEGIARRGDGAQLQGTQASPMVIQLIFQDKTEEQTPM